MVKETSKGLTYYMKYRDHNNKVVKKAIRGIENITHNKALTEFNRVKKEVADIKAGIAPEQKKDKNKFNTLNDLADYYFENHEFKRKKESRNEYNFHCINEEFTSKPLFTVSKDDLLEFRNKLKKKNVSRWIYGVGLTVDKTKTLSPKKVNNVMALCSTIIKYAIEHEKYKGENPFRLVKKLKVDNVRLKLMSEEEIELYLTTLKNYKPTKKIHTINTKLAYLFALLALTTGARVQTILNIKIEDIDFDNKIIHLYNFKTETPYIGHIVSDDVESVLREVVKLFDGKSEYIFYSIDTRQRYKNFPRLVKRVLDEKINSQRKEIDYLTVKEFRNVFATRLINKGMNLSYIQNLLNHKTPTMTQRYAQLLDKTGGEELKKMFDGVRL